MKIGKKEVDMIIEEVLEIRGKGLLAKLKGDNEGHEKKIKEFTEMIEYLVAISYANQVSYNVTRYIHKRILEVIEVEEYHEITKRVANEIDEYNSNKHE